MKVSKFKHNTSLILQLTTCALLLTSCGFQPVYGTHGNTTNTSVENSLATIDIGIIPNREGQYLRNALIDRFHRKTPQSTNYKLTFSPITESIRDLDITKSSDSTRAQLRQTIQFTLRDTRTNDSTPIMKRNIHAIVSYNILASEFSSRVSEDNARLNGIDDLAQQIERHLNLYFKAQNIK